MNNNLVVDAERHNLHMAWLCCCTESPTSPGVLKL